MSRTRLSTQEQEAPWVQAGTLSDCFLYWLPVSGYPSRHAERVWLNAFLSLFAESLTASAGLRCETFLQMAVVSEHVGSVFLKETQGTPKVTGLGRIPGMSVPEPPSLEDLKGAKTSGEPFNLKDWFAAYVKWIHTSDPGRMRDLFVGYGGFLTLFLPVDPRTAPPVFNITPKLRRAMPVFERQDVDGLIRSNFAMRAAWLPKSKQLFGEGLEHRTEYPGVPFVLPLPAAEHILGATPEWRGSLFDLFPVMLRESEADRGVLLMFREPAFETLLLQVLRSLEEQGLHYPGSQPRDGVQGV